MSTRVTLRGRVQQHLQDTGAAVWTTTLLDAWMDEGLRRCAPVLLYEGISTVAVSGTTDTTFTLSEDALHVARVYETTGAVELAAWRQHGTKLVLAAAVGVTGSLTYEFLGAWPAWASGDTTECPLASFQEDVVVFYATSRAYRELARGRVDYKKYATTVNNQVTLEGIERLADLWEQDFLRAREEGRTRQQLLFEQQRSAGAETT